MKVIMIILYILLIIVLGAAGAAKLLGISWREFRA